MSSSDRPLVGTRGPAARRDAERRRRNKVEGGGEADHIGPEDLKALPFEVNLAPEPPDLAEALADESAWHPLIATMWEEMKFDPARKWMTSGDWAALAIFCETLSRELEEQIITVTKEGIPVKGKIPVKGATLGAYLKLLEHLGVTESGRLRLRKEVTLFPERGPELAAVTDIGAAREAEVQ